MSDDVPKFEIHPIEVPPRDGTPTRYFEVYEIMMVEGVKRYHLYSDETFPTEEKAKSWINGQTV